MTGRLSDPSAPIRGGGDGVLSLGTVLPGDGTSEQRAMLAGVRLAVRDVNAAGGIFGRDVVLVESDGYVDADRASEVTRRLLEGRVDAVVGGSTPEVSRTILETVVGTDAVQCSPTDTGSVSPSEAPAGSYVRTAPPELVQAEALAQLLVDDSVTEAVTVTDAAMIDRGLERALTEALDDRDVIATQVVATTDDAETAADRLTQRVRSGTAVALAVTWETGVALLRALRDRDVELTALDIYALSTLRTEALGAAVRDSNPSVADGITGTGPWPGGTQRFSERLEAFAPTVGIRSAAHAYDCAALIALAAALAGSDHATDLRSHVASVSRDGQRCDRVADCLRLIERQTDIDYDGASGSIELTPDGGPTAGTYEIWEYRAVPGTEYFEGTISTLGEVTVTPTAKRGSS